MSEFCVSVFTEKKRIINSQIFNYSTFEELEKELNNILYQETYGKPPMDAHDKSEVVKEYISENLRWVSVAYQKKDDVIKYFLAIEENS